MSDGMDDEAAELMTDEVAVVAGVLLLVSGLADDVARLDRHHLAGVVDARLRRRARDPHTTNSPSRPSAVTAFALPCRPAATR